MRIQSVLQKFYKISADRVSRGPSVNSEPLLSSIAVTQTTTESKRIRADSADALSRTCYTDCRMSIVRERCNPWPHVANRHISISQLLSLWRHSHYDVSRLRCSRRSKPPFSLWRHSHCDVIRYWAGHALLRLIYKDVASRSFDIFFSWRVSIYYR